MDRLTEIELAQARVALLSNELIKAVDNLNRLTRPPRKTKPRSATVPSLKDLQGGQDVAKNQGYYLGKLGPDGQLVACNLVVD